MERFQTKRPKGPFARAVSRWRRRAAAVALPVMLSSIPLGASVNGTQLSEHIPDTRAITLADDTAQNVQPKTFTEPVVVAAVDPTTFIEEHPVLQVAPVIEPETTLRSLDIPTENINARISDAFVTSGETKPEPITTALLTDIPFTIEEVEQQFTIASLPPLGEPIFIPDLTVAEVDEDSLERLQTPYPGGRLSTKLRRSADLMRELGLTADSVIAVHDGKAITVAGYLSDKDANRLPVNEHFFELLQISLSKYGFERTHAGSGSGDTRLTVRKESGGWPAAMSTTGAMGLGQFMPITVSDYDHNPFDPDENIAATRRLIADLKRSYGKNWPIAYNWGPGNLSAHLRKHGGISPCHLPAETMAYAGLSCRKKSGASAASEAFSAVVNDEKPKRKRFFLFGRRDGEQRRVTHATNDMR